MVARKRAPNLLDLPCAHCNVPRKNHAEEDEGQHHFQLRDADFNRLTESELGLLIRYNTRRSRGDYDVPLPSAAERRRIRKQAGLTQQDVADILYVSRHTVSKWENPAVGYVGNERLPGREPVGEIRRNYARLLQQLAEMVEDGGSSESS